MDNPISSLPPKYVAGVVVVGVAAGLLWRKYKSNSTATPTVAPTATTDPTATTATDINTPLPTVGATAGGIVGTTTDTTNSATNAGTLSGITLPIQEYVVTVNGVQYATSDGVTLKPLNPPVASKPTITVAAHTVKRGDNFAVLVAQKYALSGAPLQAKIKELAMLNNLTLGVNDTVKPWASGMIVYI